MSKHDEPSMKKPKKIYFFCNEVQEELVPNTVSTVTKIQDYEQLIAEGKLNTAQCRGIIILLELLWDDNKYYTDLFGLKLIYQIRIHQNNYLPIILTSNYPNLTTKGLGFDLTFAKEGYRYLKDPGIKFIPLNKLNFHTYNSILQLLDDPVEDDFLKKDLTDHLYGIHGYISNFFHDLHNAIYSWKYPIDSQDAKIVFKKEFVELLRILTCNEQKEALKNLLDSYFSESKRFTKSEIVQFINQTRTITSYESEADIPILLNTKVRVLYIGDQLNIKQNLGKRLKKFGINCFQAQNSTEAITILKNERDINVLMCDFRLYDQDGRFSKEQGYHILKNIYSHCPNIYYPIILSNFDSNTIQGYFGNDIQPIVIDKKILIRNDTVFSNFAQLIIEKDTKVKANKTNLPEFGKFMGLYLKHINSPDFEQIEQNITKFANDIIKKIQDELNPDLSPLEKISGGLAGKKTIQNLKNFRIKLKARRIALGLCQIGKSKLKYCANLTERWSVIYSVLNHGAITKNIDADIVQPFISKHLMKMHSKKAYSWKDAVQHRLTPKEKEWLIKYGEQIENHQL